MIVRPLSNTEVRDIPPAPGTARRLPADLRRVRLRPDPDHVEGRPGSLALPPLQTPLHIGAEQMTEHTPTPWRFHEVKTWPMSIEGRVHRIVNDDDFPMAFVPAWDPSEPGEIDGRAEAEANAAFIVNACNAHDALVAALKRAEQFIVNGTEYGFIRMPDEPDPALTTLPAISAALALARPSSPGAKARTSQPDTAGDPS